MLAHGEIVIGTPDRDRLWPVMMGKTACVREASLVPQYIDENPISPFAVKTVNRLRKSLIVIHFSPIPVYSYSKPRSRKWPITTFLPNIQREPFSIRTGPESALQSFELFQPEFLKCHAVRRKRNHRTRGHKNTGTHCFRPYNIIGQICNTPCDPLCAVDKLDGPGE